MPARFGPSQLVPTQRGQTIWFPETERVIMTENDSTTEVQADEKPSYKAGSWQDNLSKATTLTDRVKKGSAKAQSLMWEGAQGAISSWLPKSDKDETGEKLNAALVKVLGTSNKGTASKIVTIAKAVRNDNLNMADYSSLSKAYSAASKLSPKARKAQDDEDKAADEAVSAIVAPKSSSSPEGAAKIVLSKGVDEAARLLLDELGATNLAAHRAFMRAVSQEIAGRIPKPAPKVAKPKAAKKGKAKAAKKTAAKKAAPKAAATKAKPVPVAARVGTKAKPVAVKAKPVKA
jgi:hypothetical protein